MAFDEIVFDEMVFNQVVDSIIMVFDHVADRPTNIFFLVFLFWLSPSGITIHFTSFYRKHNRIFVKQSMRGYFRGKTQKSRKSKQKTVFVWIVGLNLSNLGNPNKKCLKSKKKRTEIQINNTES
jgi:hypothetical protein